ncbi:MFS transporter [Lactobacillus sp. Sy-1]|uniref:MFS transporter n=1 Tax=Lactobacillus sp. Sy-1 TaxID=2109645 RepID=UPI001C589F77|nr:MFS transporter [Lactobacillus sp. Sy-1]MBW1605137.1 MFS transporter [Lactobacillus sp. Sy-1]
MDISTSKATLVDQMNHAHESKLFYKIISLVSAGMFLDAVDVYLASAVSSSIVNSHWADAQQNAYFLSSGFLGLFIGSIMAGIIGDIRGRKIAYQINLLLFGLFTFLGAFAVNVDMLIICRLIASIGLGSEIVTGYSMVNEFAPIHSRGKWCAIVSTVANMGAPVTIMISSFIIPAFGWRVLFITIGIFAVIIWFLRRDIPESPRWLINHNRIDEAKAVINQMNIHSDDDQPKNERIQTNFKHRPMWINLVVATIAVSAVIICQYTFTSWVPTLLVKRGIDVHNSLFASAIMLMGAPIGCAFGSFMIDKIGRKKVIVPAFFMSAILGIIYAFQTTITGVEIIGFVLNFSLYVLMASVVAVYVSELFTTKVRFRCVGIANGISKLCTVAMPIVVTWLLMVSSPTVIFILMGIISVFAGAMVWFFGEETNHRNVD